MAQSPNAVKELRKDIEKRKPHGDIYCIVKEYYERSGRNNGQKTKKIILGVSYAVRNMNQLSYIYFIRYCREKGGISYTQSARTEEGLLYTKVNPNIPKMALHLNLELARTGFWNLFLSSGLGKLSGSEKVQ